MGVHDFSPETGAVSARLTPIETNLTLRRNRCSREEP
jgi:hypothetical protein